MRGIGVATLLFLGLVLVPAGAEAAPSAGRPLTLVALGSFQRPSLKALASHIHQKFHVRVSLRRSVPFPSGAYDGSRKQYVGEKLLGQLERNYPQGVVIGITDQDMYMAASSFRYVFAIRDARASVVSSARMDPTFYGLPADKELRDSRIDKMVAKIVGVLAFGRRESADPRSALYGRILGVDDLDFMSEEFRPRPYPADKRAWLAAADAACNTTRAETAALSGHPTQTSDQLLDVLGQAIKLESDLFAAISPMRAPRDDAALVTKLRSAFARAVAADQAALAGLKAHWDLQEFQQTVAANQVAGLGLKATSLRLGSRGCAAYFGA